MLTGASVGEGWAGVIRGVADGDDVVKLLINETIERLARLRRRINPTLCKCLQRKGSHECLLRASTFHLHASAGA